MKTEDRLLTIKDLADRLNISAPSIYRYRSEGQHHLLPPAVMVGTRPRWRAQTVEAWLEEQEGKESA